LQTRSCLCGGHCSTPSLLVQGQAFRPAAKAKICENDGVSFVPRKPIKTLVMRTVVVRYCLHELDCSTTWSFGIDMQPSSTSQPRMTDPSTERVSHFSAPVGWARFGLGLLNSTGNHDVFLKSVAKSSRTLKI